VEVRLWHEFSRYVSLIAAKTTEGRSLFAPAFLCDRCSVIRSRGRRQEDKSAPLINADDADDADQN
jgi:hypothetical protein